MRNFIIILGLAGVLGSSATAARAAFSDDFSVSQTSATNNSSSGFGTGSTLLTSYGDRTIYAYVVSNTAPGDARARTAVSNGTLSFSSDDEVTGFGYVDFTFTTPISLGLTPAFQFTLLSNDVAGTLNITEHDTSGNVVTSSAPLPAMPVSGMPLLLTIPASLLGVNIASISRLDFSFGGTKSEDLSIDSIAVVTVAVPEPGSLALLGAAAVGAGGLIRRRYRRA